jgi:hypothetical protein
VLFDAVERAQLSDLFEELGPEAPTLLEPWTTHDLATHLVLRERDYLAGPGLVLPGAWSCFAERRRTALALSDSMSFRNRWSSSTSSRAAWCDHARGGRALVPQQNNVPDA